MQNMAEGLAGAGAEVHQFALNTNKHYVAPESLPERFRSIFHFQSSPIRTNVTVAGAVTNFSGGMSPTTLFVFSTSRQLKKSRRF